MSEGVLFLSDGGSEGLYDSTNLRPMYVGVNPSASSEEAQEFLVSHFNFLKFDSYVELNVLSY